LEDAQNVLVRNAPDTHFDIVAKVDFSPGDTYQTASIFIRLEDDSIMSLGRGFCQAGESPACVGSGIYFDGPEPHCQMGAMPVSVDTVTLMLRRAGNTYVGYYLEGEDWIEVSRCSSAMLAEPHDVGLTVTTGDPDVPAIAADFDFFSLVERN
jgi:hypothetical protein